MKTLNFLLAICIILLVVGILVAMQGSAAGVVGVILIALNACIIGFIVGVKRTIGFITGNMKG